MDQQKKYIVLARIARAFNEAKLRWAVGASLMLCLRGVVSHFNDIDLLVEEADVEAAREILLAMGQFNPSAPNASYSTKHFHEFTIDGVDVDLIAGFAVKKDGAVHHFPMEEAHDHANVLGEAIPMESLGRWQDCYTAMGRTKKVQLIDAALAGDIRLNTPFELRCVREHNGEDHLIYIENLPGAYVRGESLAAAMEKLPGEAAAYLGWLGHPAPECFEPIIVQEEESTLEIRDADSDVIFDSERLPLSEREYLQLKALALKSAADFHQLYAAVPNRTHSALPPRKTFYGVVPRTAEEMYLHTKNVNAYYFGEIGVQADNNGSIFECRMRGFEALEAVPNFLELPACEGSYGEYWSLRKLLRRFIWHDRIHARAMLRMARRSFGADSVPDIFCFNR